MMGGAHGSFGGFGFAAIPASAAAASARTPPAAMRKRDTAGLIILWKGMFFIMSPFLPLQIAAKKFQVFLGIGFPDRAQSEYSGLVLQKMMHTPADEDPLNAPI